MRRRVRKRQCSSACDGGGREGVDSQRRDGGDHALSRRAMCLSLFRVLTVLDYTPLS